MSKIDDGGPAFPLAIAIGQSGDVYGSNYFGSSMSIRDYFAAAALPGLISSIPGPGCAAWDYYSDAAYHIADAMIAARKDSDLSAMLDEADREHKAGSTTPIEGSLSAARKGEAS